MPCAAAWPVMVRPEAVTLSKARPIEGAMGEPSDATGSGDCAARKATWEGSRQAAQSVSMPLASPAATVVPLGE